MSIISQTKLLSSHVIDICIMIEVEIIQQIEFTAIFLPALRLSALVEQYNVPPMYRVTKQISPSKAPRGKRPVGRSDPLFS